MMSYYPSHPLYGQCANLYPNTWYQNNHLPYQQGATASAATLFSGGNGIHNNEYGATTGNNGGGSGGGGSPDSEGQSPYYQHFQHAMFQQGSPEWMGRSGTPPTPETGNGGNRQANMRAFAAAGYPGMTGMSQNQHKMGNMMMSAAATDLRMDKLGHLTALPSPPISSPGGNCQTTKQGKELG